MPMDPKTVHMVDQLGAEVLERGEALMEESFHRMGVCSESFSSTVILLLQTAITAGATVAMAVLAEHGRIKEPGE